MTKQEFETRTGLTLTSNEFDYVNRIYMAAGSLDKDSFCKEIKEDKKATLRTSDIVCTIVIENENQAETIRLQGEQLQREQENFKAYNDHMADFLILQAEKWSASDLREKAIKMVGIKEYLRRRIDFGFSLWEEDKKALTEILTAE